MGENAGILLRAFINSQKLERGTQVHVEEQTQGDQRELDVSPNVYPEKKENPEIDMSPAKSLIVFREISYTAQIERPRVVESGVVGVSKKSSESDDEVIVNGYCSEKLRSLSEGELQTLAEIGEESFEQFLGGLCDNGITVNVKGISHGVNS